MFQNPDAFMLNLVDNEDESDDEADGKNIYEVATSCLYLLYLLLCRILIGFYFKRILSLFLKYQTRSSMLTILLGAEVQLVYPWGPSLLMVMSLHCRAIIYMKLLFI